jgi:hypothetical protein
MKAAVALFVSITLLGCFPTNPKARTYAKWVEGGMVVSGIAISAIANTGADCDAEPNPGPNDPEDDCRTTAKWLSTAGVALILGGLLGFVATIATAEDAEVQKKIADAEAHPVKTEEKPKLPPGVNPQPAQQPQTPPPDQTAPAPTTESTPSQGSGSTPPM